MLSRARSLFEGDTSSLNTVYRYICVCVCVFIVIIVKGISITFTK